ncbi:MAG: 2-phospho-L-lactate transferase [Acidimicrobiales bacterium]
MIAVLAGGVGAAKFLEGLVQVVPQAEIVVVGNTGDDAVVHGLHVSPDLDTVTYTLAGASNRETGWGIAGDTFKTMDALDRYASETWFRLGDRDLATHLYRTERLAEGRSLSATTAEITRAWGIELRLLPMSDDAVRTVLTMKNGEVVEFQEYFVHRRHSEPVRSVEFQGATAARPAPGVVEALERADVVILAPSNPVLSLGPILALRSLAETLQRRRESVVAISPIVGGRALKGPADHLLKELGHKASALGVARLLAPVAGSFVLDLADAPLKDAITAEGVGVLVTETVMQTPDVAASLAKRALDFARSR